MAGIGAMAATGDTGVIGAIGAEAIGGITVTAAMVLIGRTGEPIPTTGPATIAITLAIGPVATAITVAGTGTATGAGVDAMQVGTVVMDTVAMGMEAATGVAAAAASASSFKRLLLMVRDSLTGSPTVRNFCSAEGGLCEERAISSALACSFILRGAGWDRAGR
jgi:hypothetical protein